MLRAESRIVELSHSFFIWISLFNVSAFCSALQQERPPRFAEASRSGYCESYFASCAAISAFLASVAANLRRNRSIRPAVSTSFCLPVKNGWQAEQISTTIAPLWVERVWNVLPQAHFTLMSL